MATKDGAIEIAVNSGYVFTNASNDDLLIRTTTSNQSIHFGTYSNDRSAMYINSNSVTITSNLYISNYVSVGTSNTFSRINVDGGINMTGNIYKNNNLYITDSNTVMGLFKVGLPIKQQFQSATTQSNFTITLAGDFTADVTATDVYLNGNKLAYVNAVNKDYVLTVNRTGLTTDFIVSLGQNVYSGDVVDITVWPSMSNFFSQNTFIASSNVTSLIQTVLAGFNSNDLQVNQTFQLGTAAATEAMTVSAGNALFNSNLYVMRRLGIGASNPAVSLDITGTDSILLPKGTTAQRPAAPVQGYVRYNTDINTFEGYGAGNSWGSLGGVKDTNQDTYIGAESYPTSNDDALRFINSNNESMRIIRGGFVGISNIAPSERLEVSGGNAKFNSNIYVLNRLGIGASNPAVSLDITGTDSLLLPKGTTAQRPGAPVQGYIRYNTDINTFEGYGAGNAWGSLGGVKDTNQDTYISAESYPTSNDDVLRFFNSNIETMRLTKAGYLGIGKSNPQYTLDLQGSVNANSYLVNGAPLTVDVGGGFISSPSNYTYSLCNVSIGSSNRSSYKLNVTGDINLTGRVLQNGYEILQGMSYTNMVTSFQMVPVSATYAINSFNASQSVFTLLCDGTVTALPSRAQVMLNGVKLVYIHENRRDFTLTVSNPTPYTTQFTVSLMYPATYGDVVDIIIWPYIPEYNGVYLESIDFASNIMFSNVGIGKSNPSYPLHLYNSGLSNWAAGIQNGSVTTLISHSNGGGIKIYGSNIPGDSVALDIGNGSNNLLYLRNDGLLGIGRSNFTGSYKVEIEGNVNANGLFIDGSPLSASIGGGFTTSSNATYTLCNVGIGNSNPSYPLDVQGNINANGVMINGLPLSTTTAGGFVLQQSGISYTSCNIGIGKSNPSYPLDVVGSINASGLLINGLPLSTSVGGGFTSTTPSISYTFCNIGLGKSNPSYPLDVNGSINASGLLINGAPLSTSIGGGYTCQANDVSYTLCNIVIGSSNVSTTMYDLDVYGQARIKDGLVTASNLYAPYISMLKDLFTSGSYSNMGTWGMFQNSNSLTISTSYSSSNYIKCVSYNADSTIAKTALSIDTSNSMIGVGMDPKYNLDVNGNINFSGKIFKNGFEFLTGGFASNNFVSSFQVVPVTSTTYISAYNSSQKVFILTAQGNLNATPQTTQVMINGTKLAYISETKRDFTLTLSSPTPYTTQFTITLMYSAVPGDVVDITVWPSIVGYNGVYLNSLDFTSNIAFSNVGIGLDIPSYPLHVYRSGLSNWATGIQNGIVTTLISHSNGSGIKIVSSSNENASTTAALECISGSNMLLYLRNDGMLGVGKSNVSGTYTLDVQGAINASGSVTSASDIRFKSDIEKLDNALSKVQQMSGYSFCYKNNKVKRQLGLIAQEVEQVLPEAVFKDDDGYMSVAYGNIVAVLIEAIKEQQAQICDLREKILKAKTQFVD